MTDDILAQALERIQTDILIILRIGFSHTVNDEQAEVLETHAWLTKPWHIWELTHTIPARVSAAMHARSVR